MTEDDKGTILKIFGDHLREIRKRQNMTQLDVEIAAGIARNDVSKIENGQINVVLVTIVKLARALKVDAAELMHKFPFKS